MSININNAIDLIIFLVEFIATIIGFIFGCMFFLSLGKSAKRRDSILDLEDDINNNE